MNQCIAQIEHVRFGRHFFQVLTVLSVTSRSQNLQLQLSGTSPSLENLSGIASLPILPHRFAVAPLPSRRSAPASTGMLFHCSLTALLGPHSPGKPLASGRRATRRREARVDSPVVSGGGSAAREAALHGTKSPGQLCSFHSGWKNTCFSVHLPSPSSQANTGVEPIPVGHHTAPEWMIPSNPKHKPKLSGHRSACWRFFKAPTLQGFLLRSRAINPNPNSLQSLS